MIISLFKAIGPLQSFVMGNFIIYLLSELSDIERNKTELINVTIVWIFSSCMYCAIGVNRIPNAIVYCGILINLLSWMIVLSPISKLCTRVILFFVTQILLITLFLMARPI